MRLVIESPCNQPWDDMEGDDRIRFCLSCTKHVYDLCAMTEREAKRFLEMHVGEELCLRIFRRPDGRVMTSECKGGSERRHRRRAATVLATTFATVAAGMVAADRSTLPELGPDEPFVDHDRIEQASSLTMGVTRIRDDEGSGPDLDERITAYAAAGEPENERLGTAAQLERLRAEAKADEDPLVSPIPIRLVSSMRPPPIPAGPQPIPPRRESTDERSPARSPDWMTAPGSKARRLAVFRWADRGKEP